MVTHRGPALIVQLGHQITSLTAAAWLEADEASG